MSSENQESQEKSKDGCGYRGWKHNGCHCHSHRWLWTVIVLLIIGQTVLFTMACTYHCMMRAMCVTTEATSR